MNVQAALRHVLARVRRRRVVEAVLLALPPAVGAIALVQRLGGSTAAFATGVGAVLAAAGFARLRLRGFDIHWLTRRLDESRPDLEDSAALLFAVDDALTPLQRLQRARLQARLAAAPVARVDSPGAGRGILVATVPAALVLAALVLWPAREPVTLAALADRLGVTPSGPSPARLQSQALRIAPPAYTGLATTRQATLDARVPEGAALEWTLRLAPQPRAAALVFHDGRRVTLAERGGEWVGRDIAKRPALYRVEVDGAPLQASRRHRLDVIPDRVPQVRVLEPDRNLSLVTRGQRSWRVAFEARDDHGVAATARLRIILAQGSGEAITFRERSVVLRGSGPPARRRFEYRLDLAVLGFAVGDDLVVQLDVQDSRRPVPHRVRGPSLILRWPSDLGTETSALDGLVRKALPTYFRSQRQIIIDAEALLQQRRRLTADAYTGRSDAIGVDQRLLRLRYGQFLGEEAEGEGPAPPTNDAEHADEAAASRGPAADDPGHAHRHADGGSGGDGGGNDTAATSTFGQEGAVLEQFGHTHDEAEAATLLDPQTRTTLKAALDQMWQSELHLRQGHPERALPYAHRALGFIKQVQQASRIYLARVGPELPPIDESRRLGGDRAGLARREDALLPAGASDPVIAAAWRALDELPPGGAGHRAFDAATLQRWLANNPSRVADPLALVAALDAVRERPGCERCRRDLRALLWPLLPRPAAATPRRDDGGVAGQRYLDALRRPEAR